jgi:hypothetical protein
MAASWVSGAPDLYSGGSIGSTCRQVQRHCARDASWGPGCRSLTAEPALVRTGRIRRRRTTRCCASTSAHRRGPVAVEHDSRVGDRVRGGQGPEGGQDRGDRVPAVHDGDVGAEPPRGLGEVEDGVGRERGQEQPDRAGPGPPRSGRRRRRPAGCRATPGRSRGCRGLRCRWSRFLLAVQQPGSRQAEAGTRRGAPGRDPDAGVSRTRATSPRECSAVAADVVRN